MDRVLQRDNLQRGQCVRGNCCCHQVCRGVAVSVNSLGLDGWEVSDGGMR